MAPLTGRPLRPQRLTLAVVAAVVAGGTTVGPALGCKALQPAAERAAAHLRAVQEPSGLFRYGFDFAARAPIAGDNIVRQAGAAYALAEYYAHGKDHALRDGLIAALNAFAARSIAFADGGLVSADGTPSGARTGATALALLAELHFYRTSGDGRYRSLRGVWERGLRTLWRPREGFRLTPKTRRTSDYFNGQIWLALAYLEATTEDPGLAEWLAEVDRDLMEIYNRAPAIGFYHWGVMAAAERYARSGVHRLRDFVLRQTGAYLRELRPQMHPTANTCYALEGLVTARGLAASGPKDALLPVLDRRIEVELAKNLGLQIASGSSRLPDGGSTPLTAEDIDRHRGAFLAGRDRPFTRIDHTQHCLSALVRAERFDVCPGALSAAGLAD